MKEFIKYCYENNKIASLYCDTEDTNLHFTGYVLGYNSDFILIGHISIHGNYDGYILKHIDDVYRVDFDGLYEKKIESLYKSKNKEPYPNKDLFSQDSDLRNQLFDYAFKNKLVISIEFSDNIVSGFVKKYDDDIICLDIISEYGNKIGTSINKLQEITSVIVDSEDEQDLKLLYNLK